MTRVRLSVRLIDDNGSPISAQVEGWSGVEAFVHQLEQCVDLMWQKRQGYGDAWRKQGWMGNLARIQSKTERLKNMLWRKDISEGDISEPVKDTAQDLINLCVFFLLNVGQENRWGRGSWRFDDEEG